MVGLDRHAVAGRDPEVLQPHALAVEHPEDVVVGDDEQLRRRAEPRLRVRQQGGGHVPVRGDARQIRDLGVEGPRHLPPRGVGGEAAIRRERPWDGVHGARTSTSTDTWRIRRVCPPTQHYVCHHPARRRADERSLRHTPDYAPRRLHRAETGEAPDRYAGDHIVAPRRVSQLPTRSTSSRPHAPDAIGGHGGRKPADGPPARTVRHSLALGRSGVLSPASSRAMVLTVRSGDVDRGGRQYAPKCGPGVCNMRADTQSGGRGQAPGAAPDRA
jgi:hypothetical protein